MIYTITLNPSIDYIVNVDEFVVGQVNRSHKELTYAGGKGINVSMMLKNLGVENTALGFVGGYTGEEITRQVDKKGVSCDFIHLEEGISRVNVKLKDSNGEETEINGNGPEISKENLESLYAQINTLREGDILVLAGSIPNTIPSDIYQDIMKCFGEKGIRFVVDATKDLLLKVLEYKPFLIKPNHHELGEIFDVKISTKDEVVTFAKKLQDMGAQNVLVSMAGEGAVLLTNEGTIHEHHGIKGTVKNSVGAGDSMVAGFIAGFLKDNSYEEAFKMGVSAGSATAFADDLATGEEVIAIRKML